MTPVESYLADLTAVRGAGTAETSGYPALARLLNEIGGALKPKITAVIHPANSGAGLPDGGFFSAKELRQQPGEGALLKLNLERGVLEVKPVEHDLFNLAQTAQVRGYLGHYGQILLTNYRSFALWTWESGKPVAGESFLHRRKRRRFLGNRAAPESSPAPRRTPHRIPPPCAAQPCPVGRAARPRGLARHLRARGSRPRRGRSGQCVRAGQRCA